MNCGHSIRMMRAWRGWTQGQLSRRSGMNRDRISLLECGMRSPRVSTVKKLCQAFRIEPRTFFAPRDSDMFVEIVSREMPRLSPSQRKIVIGYVRLLARENLKPAAAPDSFDAMQHHAAILAAARKFRPENNHKGEMR
jgi:transcriptional regulator with XRE-family HTH domain